MQLLQVLALTSDHEPALQLMQVPEPKDDQVPGMQAEQRLTLAPTVVEYCPAAQFRQAVDCGAATSIEYDPALHLRQTSKLVADMLDEYVPAIQLVHVLALTPDHAPAMHTVHVPEFIVENEPATQLTHVPAAAVAYEPGLQALHVLVLEPIVVEYVPAAHATHDVLTAAPMVVE